MNVIESNMVITHYSDIAKDLHKYIILEFLPTNNSDFNASLNIYIIHCVILLQTKYTSNFLHFS